MYKTYTFRGRGDNRPISCQERQAHKPISFLKSKGFSKSDRCTPSKYKRPISLSHHKYTISCHVNRVLLSQTDLHFVKPKWPTSCPSKMAHILSSQNGPHLSSQNGTYLVKSKRHIFCQVKKGIYILK